MSDIETESAPRTVDAANRIAFDSAVVRFQAVRAEVQQRIWIQNAAVAVVWMSAVATGLVCHLLPAIAIVCAVAFDVFVLGAAAIWMHSDIRIMQLAHYLTHSLEPLLASNGQGWEAYHHQLRPQSKLGSLWGVSSRGLLIGSQLLVAIVAASSTSTLAPSGFVFWLGVLSAWMTYKFTKAPKLVLGSSE